MMALSSDASRLFVALNYADAVLQVNMSTQTVEQTILLGSAVSALCAIPGQSTSVVVADQNTLHAFDYGVERPVTAQSGSLMPAAAITFGPTPSAFYSLAAGAVAAWQLDSSGISAANSVTLNDPYIGTAVTMTSIGNNLYIDGGSVLSIPSLSWVNQIANAGFQPAFTVRCCNNRKHGFGRFLPRHQRWRTPGFSSERARQGTGHLRCRERGCRGHACRPEAWLARKVPCRITPEAPV